MPSMPNASSQQAPARVKAGARLIFRTQDWQLALIAGALVGLAGGIAAALADGGL